MSYQPPPQRTVTPSSSAAPPVEPATGGWKSKMKARGQAWGKIAIDKSVAISDNVGGKVNNIAEKKFGTEHFWPVTGDFGREMDKCARILRAFTVEGIINEEPVSSSGETPTDSDTAKPTKKKNKKVLRKIPPKVIANAKGLVIFTSMRTGFAPFGGAGGAGIVIAKLPDGTWSAPASISPNNLSTGFLIGIDVYDAVLVVNSQEALNSFKTHKATIGAELAVAAGPYGAGASVEGWTDKSPIWSYVKSKGMYAGIEIVGQVFVERFDENAAMYHWPGVKAGDILAGKVKVPREAAALHEAIQDAETGRAQAANPLKPDGAEVVEDANGQMIIPDAGGIVLEDGEVLHLPPTPSMMTGDDAGIGSANNSRRNSEAVLGGVSPMPMPMPTPPRLPTRPSNTTHTPSTSAMVAQVETDPFTQRSAQDISHIDSRQGLPTSTSQVDDLPPAYPDVIPTYAASSSPNSTMSIPPSDDKAEPQRRGQMGAGEEMSESEKREWAEAEEMIRREKEEMEELQRHSRGAAHISTAPVVGQGNLENGLGDLHIERKV